MTTTTTYDPYDEPTPDEFEDALERAIKRLLKPVPLGGRSAWVNTALPWYYNPDRFIGDPRQYLADSWSEPLTE
jgi:hypothetical protein